MSTAAPVAEHAQAEGRSARAPEAHGAQGQPAHGGHDHAGRRGGGHKMRREPEHPRHGPPPWLISFGDMMTLFLCFFIILVTMAPVQEAGLMARGLGSFVVALESKGMSAALTGAKYLDAVNDFRIRFGLRPLTEEELLEGRVEARTPAELEALLAEALRPYTSLEQPLVARFEPGASELPEAARAYLDRIAESIRPGFGQLLILQGHGADAQEVGTGAARLGVERAEAVKRYLVDQHGFVPQRVEARTFVIEPAGTGGSDPSVDATLVQPVSTAQRASL